MSDAGTIVLALAGLLACAPAFANELPVRDPTIPPGVPAAATIAAEGPALKLRSTQVSAASQSAIINDRIVTPGSRVGGATVLSIKPGRVTLRRGSELITLRIASPDVKRPATGDDS